MARGEKGFMLLTVIWICAILMMIGFFGMESALVSEGIAFCQVGHARLLNTTEAGIEHARGVIACTGGDMTAVLEAFSDGTPPSFDVVGAAALRTGILFCGGSYRVVVEDNDDGDGKARVDSDGTIVIRSVGVDRQGRSKIIEAGVNGKPPAVVWWQELD